MDTEDKDRSPQKAKVSPSQKPRKRPAGKKVVPDRRKTPAAGRDQTADRSSVPDSDYQDKPVKLFRVIFFYEWCKSCGICSAMCPKEIIKTDEHGHPLIEQMDDCIGCRNCEIHCPDFAITVKKRHPERRKTNGFR